MPTHQIVNTHLVATSAPDFSSGETIGILLAGLGLAATIVIGMRGRERLRDTSEPDGTISPTQDVVVTKDEVRIGPDIVIKRD